MGLSPFGDSMLDAGMLLATCEITEADILVQANESEVTWKERVLFARRNKSIEEHKRLVVFLAVFRCVATRTSPKKEFLTIFAKSENYIWKRTKSQKAKRAIFARGSSMYGRP